VRTAPAFATPIKSGHVTFSVFFCQSLKQLHATGSDKMIENSHTKAPPGPQVAAPFEAVGQKLRFIGRHYHPALVWPIAAFIVAFVGRYFQLSNLDAERSALERQTLREAEVLAANYAGQVARAVEAVDQTTLHVKYEWEISRGKLRLADARETDLFPSSSILHVSLVWRDALIAVLIDKRFKFMGNTVFAFKNAINRPAQG
jgi:hypothetical protein